jgi:hypothetical protein
MSFETGSKRMFAREKRIGPYTYIYLVENVREAGRSRQRIIANRGRKEGVNARGGLDRLTRSLARLAQRSMVLSVLDGEAPPGLACRRIGPALLFERLWQETGCRDAPRRLLSGLLPRPVVVGVSGALVGVVLARLVGRHLDRRLPGAAANPVPHHVGKDRHRVRERAGWRASSSRACLAYKCASHAFPALWRRCQPPRQRRVA